jgi:ABC-type amino acid transport substrate-binding protein
VSHVQKEKVGVIDGTSTMDLLVDLEIPKKQIQLYPNAKAMLNALKNNQIKTAFLDLSVFDGYKERYNGVLQIVDDLERFDFLAFVSNKKNHDLVEKVSIELAKLQEKGLLTTYCKMYFNEKKRFCLPFVK